MNRLGELAAQLEDIGAALDDLITEELRAAIADGATTRPATERTLTQARRAVEKAAHLLGRAGADADADAS